ncbi:MAG: PQQ-binding-like beta-propeller repeat protein [Pyrinomonadaceae bacterium]
MHARMFPNNFVLLIVLTAIAVVPAVGQTVANGSNGPNGEVTLSKCWSFAVEDGKMLTAGGSHIFVGSGGAQVDALALDGKKLWATELGGEVVSNLLASEGGVFLVTSVVNGESGKSGGGTLRYLSKETGITVWSAKLPEADNYSIGLGADSVIAVTSKGVIEAYDLRTGSQKWRRELAESFVGEPRFNHTNVYVASTAKQVFTVSLDRGEIVSVRKLQFAPTAVGEITGDVFTGDDRGNLTSLGKSDKKVNWSFKSGGKISAIVEVGGNLLAASNDNFVYLFSGRNGDVAWKKRLNERISQIGVIDGRFALVSGYEENAAHLIDLDSGKLVGQLNLAVDEFAMARPVSSNGKILILTNGAVYAYSSANCS